MSVLILTEKELRKIVRADIEAIDAVAKGFRMLSDQMVVMPPIMHIEIPEYEGDVDIKSAYVKGVDRFAVKIGAGFFQNYKLGLPSSPAMMVAVSSKTGVTEAILLDNAYLTDVRTAAAGAVAASFLAPQVIDCAGVVGAGVQGRYQMKALKQVRDFRRLMVYDSNGDQVSQYVSQMSDELGIQVTAAGSVEELVAQSQCVVTCTPAKQPYIPKEFLHPGLHITAMGADLPEKRELYSNVFEAADVIACDSRTQSFKQGELFNFVSDGVQINEDDILELGEIISGKRTGRTSPDQITVCDLSGTGVQDTMIADLSIKKAMEQKMGSRIIT